MKIISVYFGDFCITSSPKEGFLQIIGSNNGECVEISEYTFEEYLEEIIKNER